MGRPEIAQKRIRDVGVENLGRPALPLGEQRRQLVDELEARIALEKRGRGWRRLRSGGQPDHENLAPLIRAEQRKEERDHKGDRA